MKVVKSNRASMQVNSSTCLDEIPNIDNKPMYLKEVLEWLDKLVEVSQHDANTSDY